MPCGFALCLAQDDGRVTHRGDGHNGRELVIEMPPVLGDVLALGGADAPVRHDRLEAFRLELVQRLPEVALPHGELHQLRAFLSGEVEDDEGDAGSRAEPVQRADAALHAEIRHTAPERIRGIERRNVRKWCGHPCLRTTTNLPCIHLPRNGAQHPRHRHGGERHRLLEFAVAVGPRVRDAGAGENVVEVREQDAPPILVEGGVGGARVRLQREREETRGFRVQHPRLAVAVGALDDRLGGVAPREFMVEFVADDAQPLAPLVQFLEERLRRRGKERREDGPGIHLAHHEQIAARGAAAVVAHAVDDHRGLQSRLLPHGLDGLQERRGLNRAIVAALLGVVDEHLGTVRTLPHERLGDGLVVRAGAVHEDVLHAALHEVARVRRGMAKGVGRPVDGHVLGRQSEELAHVGAGLEEVLREGLGAGHVRVVLDPVRSGDFPTPLLHVAGDFRKHLGGEFLDDGVDARLRLREAEFGELVQEREHGAERVEGRHDRLWPTPHPVHVNVGVAHAMDFVLLGGGGEGLESLLHIGAYRLGRRAGFRDGGRLLGKGLPCGLRVLLACEPFRELDLRTDSEPEGIVLPLLLCLTLLDTLQTCHTSSCVGVGDGKNISIFCEV